MRKILAVLTVLVLGLVLVACSPDTSEIDTFLSPNKIVYTLEETNAGGPIIELGDFEFYSIQKNKTSSKVSIASTEVTRNSLGNNVYEITVRGLSYNVYVYEAGYEDTVANPNQIVVSALSPTYGVEDDAEKIERMLEEGYVPSALPASAAPEQYQTEQARRGELKWDTVVKKWKRMRHSSLEKPFLVLHGMGRNGSTDRIDYAVVVTISVPNYQGNLYEDILNEYKVLEPVSIRNKNEIMVNL